MPSLAPPAWSPVELEDRVEAFEAAWNNGAAELDAFLPAPDASSYLEVLCELIRVDLERHWSNGRPRALQSYLADYPQLNSDRATLGQLAFEEYRQRLQAGQPVDAEEYAREFDLNVSRWPKPAALRRPVRAANDVDSPPTRAVSVCNVDKNVSPNRPAVEFPRVARTGTASNWCRNLAAARSAGSSWPARAIFPTASWPSNSPPISGASRKNWHACCTRTSCRSTQRTGTASCKRSACPISVPRRWPIF